MNKITIDRAVMEQALDYLDAPSAKLWPAGTQHRIITALRAALAEPEPRNQCGETCERAKLCAVCLRGLAEPEQEPEELKDPAEYDDFAAAIRHNERVTTRRYDSVGPVALETVYETIIHWDEGWGGKRSRRELARRIVDLYTAPPQRNPLTKEEIDGLFVRSGLGAYHQKDFAVQTEYDRCIERFARAIEAARNIGEKE